MVVAAYALLSTLGKLTRFIDMKHLRFRYNKQAYQGLLKVLGTFDEKQIDCYSCSAGDTTFSLMTLSIMTLSIMTLSILTLNIMTLSITIKMPTLSLKTFGKTPLSIEGKYAECSIVLL
jgi:hypothetical protein